MRQMALMVLVVLFTAARAHGVYETPTSDRGCRIEPYARAMAIRVLDSLESVCNKQGYEVTALVESEYDHVTLDNFVYHLTYSTGVFGIATHGSSSGVAVEVFSDVHARDSAYSYYLAHGYSSDEIYKAEGDTPSGCMYHIGATSLLIYRCFRGRESIVHNASCYGDTYCDAWFGAREVLDYSGSVTWGKMRSDAELFWSRLNGNGGKSRRYVGGALSGLGLRRCGGGNGNTVLSPTVEAYYPWEWSEVGFGLNLDV